MITYIVGDCPICVGHGELIALCEKNSSKLIFYCHACSTAWDKIPTTVDEIKSLDDLTDVGVIFATQEILTLQEINIKYATNEYESVNDL